MQNYFYEENPMENKNEGKKELVSKMLTILSSSVQMIPITNKKIKNSFSQSMTFLFSYSQLEIPDKFELPKQFLSPFYEVSTLQNNTPFLTQTIRAIVLLMNNSLINESIYYTIINILTNFSNRSQNQMHHHFETLFQILDNLIKKDSIHLSFKITKSLFELAVSLHIKYSQSKLSENFLIQYTLILFKFLDDLIRPVLMKNKHNPSHEKLDTFSCGNNSILIQSPKRKEKKMVGHSFYTINESQSEYDQSINGNSNFNCPRISGGDLSFKIELYEYKNFDIYKNCDFVFSYYIGVLGGKTKGLLWKESKMFAIDIIEKIILATQDLFFYIDDFINVIQNDLANELSYIIKAKCNNNIEFKEKVYNLVFTIVKNYHIAYNLLPLCLNENINFSSAYDDYLSYKLLLKICQNFPLINDLYQLKLEKVNELFQKNAYSSLQYNRLIINTIDYLVFSKDLMMTPQEAEEIRESSIIDRLMVTLSETKLKRISKLKTQSDLLQYSNNLSRRESKANDNVDDLVYFIVSCKEIEKKRTIKPKSKIYKKDYVEILSEICLALGNVIDTVLSKNHIDLETPIAVSKMQEESNEYTQIKAISLYFAFYIRNLLSCLIKEDNVNSMSKYIEMVFHYIKVLSVLWDDRAKDEYFNIILECINREEITNEVLFFLSKQFFAFIENIQLNSTIESWLSILKIMQGLYIKLFNIKCPFLFIPQPQKEIDDYIRHIEQFIRLFSFNFFDTILKTETEIERKESYNEFQISSTNLIVSNDESSCVQKYIRQRSKINSNNPLMTSNVESTETNNSTYRISSLFKFNHNMYSAHSLNSFNLCKKIGGLSFNLNIISDDFEDKEIPQMSSFLEEDTNSHLTLCNYLDSFFIENSVNYEDEFFKSIATSALVKSCLLLIKEGNVQGIQFNLLKIVELISVNVRRVNSCWSKFTMIIFDIFIRVEDINVKILCFDVIAMITMFIINLFQEQENPSDEWARDNYQVLLFENIKMFMEKCVEMKISTLYDYAINNLYVILVHLGSKINRKGWKRVIELFLNFIQKENSQETLTNAFWVYEIILKGSDNLRLNDFTQEIYMMHQIFMKYGNNESKVQYLRMIEVINKNIDNKNLIEKLIFEGIKDNCYNIRKETFEIFGKVCGKGRDCIEINSWLDYIYTRYREEIARRGITKEFFNDKANMSKQDKHNINKIFDQEEDEEEENECIIISHIKTCHLKRNCYIMKEREEVKMVEEIPKEESEWESTIIWILSLYIENNNTIFRKDNIGNIIKILEQITELCSPHVMIKLIELLIQLRNYDKDQIDLLFKKIINLVTTLSYIISFPNNIMLITKIIDYLKPALKENITCISLSQTLSKLIQCSNGKNQLYSDSLEQKDKMILDFADEISQYHPNEVFYYYLSWMHINILAPDFYIISKSARERCEKLVDNHVKDITITQKEIKDMIKMIKVNLALIETKFFQVNHYKLYNNNEERICDELILYILRLIAKIISSLNNNSYFQIFYELILYLFQNCDNIILLQGLCNFICSSLIQMTSQYYPSFKSQIYQMCKEYIFRLKESDILATFTFSLFDEKNYCEFSNEILVRYLTEELLNNFSNEERRNEMPLQRKKVDHIKIILSKLNDYVNGQKFLRDKNYERSINKLKTSLIALTSSNEVKIREISNSILAIDIFNNKVGIYK